MSCLTLTFTCLAPLALLQPIFVNVVTYALPYPDIFILSILSLTPTYFCQCCHLCLALPLLLLAWPPLPYSNLFLSVLSPMPCLALTLNCLAPFALLQPIFVNVVTYGLPYPNFFILGTLSLTPTYFCQCCHLCLGLP